MTDEDFVIGVHDAQFHADDTLAVYLLRQLPKYSNSRVIRTRDPDLLARCHIVCDVGDVYNHSIRRYDHHQVKYKATFPGSPIPCCSCGLIYFHYGYEIIHIILKKKFCKLEGIDIERIRRLQYEVFMKEIDAGDNGISEHKDGGVYSIHSSLAERIAAMNPHWKTVEPDRDRAFEVAVQYIGREFDFFLEFTYLQLMQTGQAE
jgi:uncharacterized UPF0160 family protein